MNPPTNKRRKPYRHSKTSLGEFLKCPRLYFYSRHPEVPKKVDHKRLCGAVVHEVVQRCHKETKEPRPFYFKEKKGALGFFWHRYFEELAKARETGKLPPEDRDSDEKFLGVGRHAISNYWDANVNLPRPLEVETTYRAKVLGGIPLIGIFDQVRSVSVDWFKKHRPELVKDDVLEPSYDPVIIVDLKTEYNSFDPDESRDRVGVEAVLQKLATNFKGREQDFFRLFDGGRENEFQALIRQLETKIEKPQSPEDEMRKQFELHESIQATLYTLLYFLKHGKKPVAFCWYHLRTNKWFTTWREEKDFEDLYGIIRFCHENIINQHFPKNVGPYCASCDFCEICHEDRPWLISRPETPGDASVRSPEIRPPLVQSPLAEQRTFRLSVKRRKIQPPAVVPVTKPVVRCLPSDLPWRVGATEPLLPGM